MKAITQNVGKPSLKALTRYVMSQKKKKKKSWVVLSFEHVHCHFTANEVAALVNKKKTKKPESQLRTKTCEKFSPRLEFFGHVGDPSRLAICDVEKFLDGAKAFRSNACFLVAMNKAAFKCFNRKGCSRALFWCCNKNCVYIRQ